MSPKALKASIIVLFILVFLSLGLNLYLTWQLLRLQKQAQDLAQDLGPIVQETLSQAAVDLESFKDSTIEFDVQVNEEFPVQANIPFNETIEVPIKVTIPINEQIETSVVIDPFQSGLEIPVDIAVPVDMEVPIDMVVPVSIDRTIPISTTVPLNVSVPIAIDLGETELAGFVERLHTGLVSLEESIGQLMPVAEQ